MNKTKEHTSRLEPGMKCPQCGAFIIITVSDRITKNFFECPNCHLRLSNDRLESKPTSEALRKVQKAQEKLEEKSKFNG